MSMQFRGWLVFFLSFLYFFSSNIYACTDFRLTATDGTVLITRSMEFGLDMKSNLRTSPRGRVFSYMTDDNKQGLSWKAKYGYIYLDGLNIDTAVDGMNEAGLSFEGLLFPDYAQYQTYDPLKAKSALPYIHLGDWILGNFKSVNEVKLALPSILVYAQKIQGMGDVIFPMHFSIFDANGKGLVAEYTQGKLTLYENRIGIMTNSPTYEWHLQNLINYIHLAPENPPAVVIGGLTFAATGQGFGMVGLPGDISPPSRFVKIAALLRTALPQSKVENLLNLAEHIINNVDIPLGFVREPNNGNRPTNELTEWVVFKDLTHRQFYYRTYEDLTLHKIDLNALNLSESSALLRMPLSSVNTVKDDTDLFKNSMAAPSAPQAVAKR